MNQRKPIPAEIKCIYYILNLVNDKCYIGSAVNFYNRKAAHISELKNKNHHSIKLQNAWKKYGQKNFVFEILEVVETGGKKELFEREQVWLDFFKPEYNMSPLASGGSWDITDETRKEMSRSRRKNNKKYSERMKGVWANRTKEEKDMISRKANETKNNKPEEEKAEIRKKSASYGMKNKKHKKKSKKKTQDALKGRKIGGALKTEQVSKKIKEQWADPNSKYNSDQYQKGVIERLNTPEANKKKQNWKNPQEVYAKLALATKNRWANTPPENRGDASKLVWEKRTMEQRKEIGSKIWKTRKRKMRYKKTLSKKKKNPLSQILYLLINKKNLV